MDSDWTASALFSPSKARAQQAQAKDWAAVDSWVSKKYGSRLPAYERNEDTLHALLTLANLNESADEQRAQVDRIERAAYQSLGKRSGGISEEIIQALQAELANETHLETLAELVVALNCPTAETSALGREIIELNSSEFDTRQHVQRAESQLAALKTEQARVQSLIDELAGDAFQAPSEVTENTVEWTRSTKTLKAKIAEYEERLGASRPTTTGDDFARFQGRLQENARQRERLSRLEAELEAFQDLPSDPKAARAKLEQARDQLLRLTSKRDRMFEGLAER